jgi:hypothetical protein
MLMLSILNFNSIFCALLPDSHSMIQYSTTGGTGLLLPYLVHVLCTGSSKALPIANTDVCHSFELYGGSGSIESNGSNRARSAEEHRVIKSQVTRDHQQT